MPKGIENPDVTKEPAESSAAEENGHIDANAEGEGQGAESSPAEGQKDAKEDKRSLLNVVQDVLKDSDKSGESSTQDGGKDSEKDAEGQGDEGKKPDAKDEDDSKLPFHNHPRWQEVLAENRALKADAEVGTAVRTYQANTGVTGDELNQLLHVGNLGKNDPEKAIPLVEAYLEKLRGYVGEKLPDDLEQKVKDGYMDEETARQISKERANARWANDRLAAAESRQETDNARAAVQVIVGAVDTWEKQQEAKDPDYAKKKPLVHAFVSEHFTKFGRPKDRDGALKVAEEALKRANEVLKPVAQPSGRTAIKNVPSQTGKPAVSSQPKSMLEAVRAAAGK